MIMYDTLTAAENLRFFGKLYDMPKEKIELRIDELLDLVDMQEWKNTQISKFSTGMKQRINVIRALLPEPKFFSWTNQHSDLTLRQHFPSGKLSETSTTTE